MQPVEFEFIYMFNLSSKTGILFQDIRQTQTPCAIKTFALNSRKLFLRLFALIYSELVPFWVMYFSHNNLSLSPTHFIIHELCNTLSISNKHTK